MYKIFLNTILLICLSFPLIAQEEEGIRFFQGSWKEALQQAKKEGKMIFMDCYADWCGPCFNMAKNIFTQKEVGDFFNKHFICMKCNMEKGEEGKALQKKFDVVAYPTYLFITNEGYVAQRGSGFLNVDPFIDLAQKALSVGNNGYEERFAKGERDEKFLKQFLAESLSFHQADRIEEVLNQLYNEGNKHILQDKDYWQAFDCCAADIDSPLSLAFLKDYKKLCKIHGKFSIDQKIRNLYASVAKVLALCNIQGRQEIVLEDKKQAYFQKMQERKIPFCSELQEEIEYIILLRSGKYEEAYALGEKALSNADSRMLCNWATLGERIVRNNQEIRTQMAKWMKRAIEKGVDASMQEEAQNVLQDLTNSANPIYAKGKARKSIPMRGYLNE